MRNPRIILYIALALAILRLGERLNAEPVRADYQRCVTIHNEPLIDHPKLHGNAAPVSDLASWKQ